MMDVMEGSGKLMGVKVLKPASLRCWRRDEPHVGIVTAPFVEVESFVGGTNGVGARLGHRAAPP